ncbi:imidazolonepropionase [Salinihabitans flavidus]|uniref:Imidazolonepropionase n=1 Tax=Salinihabitans flavidus TaxID=569882 RepID=A0A1H8S2P7_9RHOB|nr:imidazolonepropionase [Salinihabitans flavidus]SEO72925.1 imidazolonepropionase [Salinihabitans flavidus]
MTDTVAFTNAILTDADNAETSCVLTRSGRITYCGPEAGAPVSDAHERVDCGGRLITPALVDCHTHIVHGGERSLEFQMRQEGRSYSEIAQAGGGILSTVTATNALSVEELVETALPRLDHLLTEGVCTVEVKSGYGLTIEGELNMLRAARQLEKRRKVRVRTSYLAAHALPPEYRENRQGYLDDVVIAGLRAAHDEGLVDAVDGFCEHIAFSPKEIAQVFDLAAELELPVKLHAEQLSDLGGAALAARYGALSADHLEYLSDVDARVMAEAGTVAVLLPGAFYTLHETQLPPMKALREAGAKLALATDCNPGSAPLTSLLLTMNMGATLFGMTVPECIEGTTANAAKALGLEGEVGTLMPGASADLAIWDVKRPAELVYRIGFNPLWRRYFKGEYAQ